MATGTDFIAFLLDQVEPRGWLTARKMFGEYALYANERVVALACDDRLFVKPTPGGRAFIGEPDEALPYPGGKPYFVVEDRIEDRAWLSELLRITAREVPAPKPKPETKAKPKSRAKPNAQPKSKAGPESRPKSRPAPGTGTREAR